jgi:hypothetical protein
MSGPKIEETLEDLHEFHDRATGMWTSDWVLQVCVVLRVCGRRGLRGRDVCACVYVCVWEGGRLRGVGPSDVALLAQP